MIIEGGVVMYGTVLGNIVFALREVSQGSSEGTTTGSIITGGSGIISGSGPQ